MGNKIYVHIGPHLGLMQATIIPVGAPGEQVFISKDAILKWARDEKKEYALLVGEYFDGINFYLDRLIEKIEKL